MHTMKRLQTEVSRMENEGVPSCTAGPVDSDIYHWKATIEGPSESPYENGLFELEIRFPYDYPFCPPNVIFKTPIYHPNINEKGGICVDILMNNWRPVLTVPEILLSIMSLLTDPNPESPLNIEASNLYKNDRILYNKTARKLTRKWAMTS